MSKKYIYVTLLSGLLFVLSSGFCFAFKINITSLPNLGQNPDLPKYIEVIFTYIMQIGGLIAVLMLVVGGIRWLASGGSPEKIGEAKKSINAAILGLIILLSSYLILYTINPKLLLIETYPITPIELTGDLYLSGGGQTRALPRSGIAALAIYPSEINSIITGPACVYPFLITFYEGIEWKGNFVNREISCGGSLSIDKNVNSIKVWELAPGVYLFDNSSCDPSHSRPQYAKDKVYDLGSLKEKVRCVEIINDPQTDVYYGAVLHHTTLGQVLQGGFTITDYGGGSYGDYCSTLMTLDFDEYGRSFPISGEYSAISVFPINYYKASGTGDGVMFYSNTFNIGGKYFVTDSDIMESASMVGFYQIEAGSIEFVYPPGWLNVVRESCAITSDKPNFKDCPGSIFIGGDYIVIISASGYFDEENYNCEVFSRSDKGLGNIKLEPIFNQSEELVDIYIIPTKIF